MDILRGFLAPVDLIIFMLQAGGAIGLAAISLVVALALVLVFAVLSTAAAIRVFGIRTAQAVRILMVSVFGLSPAICLAVWMDQSGMDVIFTVVMAMFALLGGGMMSVIIAAATGARIPNDSIDPIPDTAA